MAHAQQVRERLHAGPDRAGEIRAAAGDLQLRLQVSDWDRLGCLLDRLEVTAARGGRLRFDAERLAATVTYLGEKLRVIETEPGRTALLRSEPPAPQAGQTAFFEMVADRARGLVLTRQAFDPGTGERRRVAAALTRQALERLAEDLLALLSVVPDPV
ncbi:MAG: hypothetical protein ACE147_15845 [Candidatus Methylomirabilales bacterium]